MTTHDSNVAQSEISTASVEKRCPVCHARNDAADVRCWICHSAIDLRLDDAAGREALATLRRERRRSQVNHYSLRTLFLAMIVVGVCLTAARASMELGIASTLVSGLAFVRTIFIVRRIDNPPARIPAAWLIGWFIESVCILIVTAFALACVFASLSLVGFMLVSAANGLWWKDGNLSLLAWGIAFAAVVAAAFAVLLFRVLWLPADRRITHKGQNDERWRWQG